jgi:hypothetical protein
MILWIFAPRRQGAPGDGSLKPAADGGDPLERALLGRYRTMALLKAGGEPGA